MNGFGFQGIEKVLFLCPHPDDAEFSSGGTIAKLIENNIEIHYAVFSMCEKSIPKGFGPGTIKNELLQVCDFIGVKQEFLHMYDYEVRVFPQYRQEILEDMVKLNKQIKFDLVFLPGSSDVHQDHKTIYEEGIRAFKQSRVLSYEMPWNNFTFLSNLYVVLEERHLQKKIDALKLYKSQSFRQYSNEEYFRSLMRIKGLQINEKYAETFQILRWKI
jgi:LmbE family N-acetylglucosaminyl deacetylase